MNIYELLNSPATASKVGRQQMTRGLIIGPDGPRYQVTVNGIAYVADAAITDLRPGDRVWVAMGWGAPRIIGLFGPDQNEKNS